MSGRYHEIINLLKIFLRAHQLYCQADKPKAKLFMSEINGELRYVVPVEVKDYDVVRKLDFGYLADYEAFFEEDLRDVKIHTGPYADELTRNAGAYALTLGNDIYFGDGQYAPDMEEGKALLAHELAHVVQKKQGRPMGFHEDLEKLEYEAQAIEQEVEGQELHHNRGLLWAKEREDRVSRDDSARLNLEDFGQRSRKAMITCIGKRGETITMSETEYWEGIDWVRQQLKQDYKELLTDEDRYKFLKKMRKY